MKTWTPVEGHIAGTGGTVARLYSIQEFPAILDCACLIGLERVGLLDLLDQNRFRISAALRAEALKLAGE